ncbi:hypothetical protein fHeYen901_108 [Yersinia phage fHe-Yen9-01]|uniref:Uncharacterized protein n=1 Tax=Yersinia phage fHe-Yen9-01 TaxID=1965363 RepID=A0A1V0DXK4_9CAUD|nr:hypothetical protein KNT60_gp107 [Yersinia phage fHe-Yen9-01]ARB05881.1 hypothetical protein fHeYen901_108 [Yersinia phage fHe-Yen9-01]
MHIKKMISQHRRDFQAIYQCEHCEFEEKSSGYDDSFFHQNVIPKMVCKSCGLSATTDYTPRETKYDDSVTI